MTPIELGNALTVLCKETTSDLLLPVRKKPSEPPEERSPSVYLMDVPKKDDDTNAIPYIIVQILTGKHEQKPVNEPENRVSIRIVAAVYSEDMGEGKLNVLNIITRLYYKLLKREVIADHFVLAESIEWVVDPRPVPPYYFGEMLMTFEIPPVYSESLSALSYQDKEEELSWLKR